MSPDWLDTLPLDPAAPWPAMGVHTDARPWPEPADPAVLEQRRAALAAHPESVQVLPGATTDAAAAALLECAVESDVIPSPPPAGSDARAALAAVAVAQADDVCLLAPEAGWPLVAGALLFPSHWRLSEKLGRPIADVHDRVPGYPTPQVDRFLDRLRPGHVVWRRNLLVHRDGELHAPWPSTEDIPVERWWLRSERQTLRVLEHGAGAVLFTIRTDTAPLASFEPDLRRRLADRFESLPLQWRDYAGVGDRLPELLAWLRDPELGAATSS